MSDALMSTYKRLPVAFQRGQGAYLWDQHGKRYLDAVSGVAVCSLGHAHPAIAKAICEQANTLLHTSNLYEITLQQQLGDKLIHLTGMQKAFFCNSGAEANEAAIKIARLYGHKKNIKHPTIIVAENSFHGRTLATLTATGNRKVQAGFEPLVQGFVRVPYDDLAALQNVAKTSQEIVAVMLEPIQGEGGVRIPAPDYLRHVRELCDEHGWLLILDEIQTGMCRTGSWLASQQNHIQADIVTLAKALGNGMPIGACLARGVAADTFQPGNHGSTFGGNLLACRAALAVVEIMETQNMAEKAREHGKLLRAGLTEALSLQPGVVTVRGQGLMIGIELDRPCADIVKLALDLGLLVNVTADNVVRLLPPLIIGRDEINGIITGLREAIARFYNNHP